MSERSPELIDNPVKQYLDRIGQHELLSAEEEAELARSIEQGQEAEAELGLNKEERSKTEAELSALVAVGKEAKAKFINSNLRLVVSIAKRYKGVNNMDFLDLVQEGNLGLDHAVDKFNWRRGFKFSTYATWWIRQSIRRGIAEKSRSVRLPVYMYDLVNTVRNANQDLAAADGEKPSDTEIAEYTGLSIQKVEAAIKYGENAVSIFQEIGDDGTTLGDFIADENTNIEDEAVRGLLSKEIILLLDKLNDRERTILIRRYGLDGEDPVTLEEIGSIFNVTRERIRQIESAAFAKIRHDLDSDAYEDIA